MPRCVLLLSYSFPPIVKVGGHRAARFSKYLPQFGWKAIIVTRPPTGPGIATDASLDAMVSPETIVLHAQPWRALDGLRRRLGRGVLPLQTGVAAGLPHASGASSHQDRTAFPSKPYGQGGIASQIRGWVRSAAVPCVTPDPHVVWSIPAYRAARRAIVRYGVEVILTTSPPPSVHLSGLALKLATGLPLVMDLRDPWTRNPWQEAHDFAFRRSANRTLERVCVSRADAVILNTPETFADFCEFYPKAWHRKFHMIPNGYDPELLPRIKEAMEREAPASDRGVLKLCHAGAVFGRRDVRPLIAAVADMARRGRPVHFEQVGSVENEGEVRSFIANHRAQPYVQLLGQQSHDEALRRQAGADILVAVRQNTGIQVPAKLYEMMLFNKPILALDDRGALTRFVLDHDLGVAADPTDPAAIAAAILQAAGHPRSPSARRQAALFEFSGSRQTERLAEILGRVTSA